MTTRVCFVLRSFAPRNESGSLRCTAFAKYLPQHNCNVSIFCAAPDEHNVTANTSAHVDETWEDLPEWTRVTRVRWNALGSSSSNLRRLPIGASIDRRRILRGNVNRLYPDLAEHLESCGPNVLFASCAPPETLLLAERASREFQIPFVADLRDPWSTVSTSPYRHYIDFLCERRLEQSILHRAALVTVASQRAGELLEKELRVDPEKIVFLPNGFDEDQLDDHVPPSEVDADKFLIVHSGELGQDAQSKRYPRLKRLMGLDYDPLRTDSGSRSPVNFMKALKALLSDAPELRETVRVAFTGLQLDHLPKAIREFPYPECILPFGRISSPQAHGLMARADLLLLMVRNNFRNGREFCTTIPAKTYSYLRFGRPILATIISSEMKQLLSHFPNVHTVPPDDISGIRMILVDQIKNHWTPRCDLSLPACPASLKQYDRRETAKHLAKLIHFLAEG